MTHTLRLATIVPDTPNLHSFVIFVSDQYEETAVQDSVPDMSDVSAIEEIGDVPWTPPTQLFPPSPPTDWWKPPGYENASMQHDHDQHPPAPPQQPAVHQIPVRAQVPGSAFPRERPSEFLDSTLETISRT